MGITWSVSLGISVGGGIVLGCLQGSVEIGGLSRRGMHKIQKIIQPNSFGFK